MDGRDLEAMNVKDVEKGLLTLARRGLVAPQDQGETQSKIIIEFRGLLEELVRLNKRGEINGTTVAAQRLLKLIRESLE